MLKHSGWRGYAADTLSTLHDLARGFQLHLREWGLQLSVEKTGALSSQPGVPAPIQVEEFVGDKIYRSTLSIWRLLSKDMGRVTWQSRPGWRNRGKRFGHLLALYGMFDRSVSAPDSVLIGPVLYRLFCVERRCTIVLILSRTTTAISDGVTPRRVPRKKGPPA